MSTIASYTSLITRATAAESDDQSQAYDLADKIKGEGVNGATLALDAMTERLESSESHIRIRLLDILDTLVFNCGEDLHNALAKSRFLVALAGIHDKQVEAVIPDHLAKWRGEMGSGYDSAFEQAFSQRSSSGNQGTTSSQNNPRPATLTRRSIGGVSQFKVKPVKRLYPFLTIAYFRALRIIEAARNLHVFHMQGIHIARQALHLVIMLNDSVNEDQGPNQAQEDERIDLEDELLDLEDAIPTWDVARFESKEDYLSRVNEIKDQYQQFFKTRFYFSNGRDPNVDGIYRTLLAYDQKTLKLKHWQEGLIDDDDDEGRSTGFIESVHTSPALSQRAVPREESQVHLSLDPSSSTAAEAPDQPVASTSAAAAASAEAADDIEAARRFRRQEEGGDEPAQTFNCPVPGCGRTFDRQHLLRHHIREHDDRPYRCPMRGCDRRFATPTEQRVHEALHRIRNMGIIPNMPAFAPPIASNPTPAPPVPDPVTTEEAAAEEVKSEGKPEDPDAASPRQDADRPMLDDADRPAQRQDDQEEKDVAEAIERSIQDQHRIAEEQGAAGEGEASTSNQ